MAIPATATVAPPLPPEPAIAAGEKPPPSAAESNATPRKRKLEEVGFQHSPYYKIRAAVANLRGRFLQVCQATDSKSTDAAPEILKEMEALVDLSKKMRFVINAVAEPVKPLHGHAARGVNDKPVGKIPSKESHQVHQTGWASFVRSPGPGEKVPPKPVSTPTAARLPVEIQEKPKQSEITSCAMQLGKGLQGSYVIGGSPIGWNFVVWSGGKAVYYGLTRAEWLARQSAKSNATLLVPAI